MKGKLTQILLLFMLLILPALLFVFLKIFGENKYEVQKFHVNELSEGRGTGCKKPILPYRLSYGEKGKLGLIVPVEDKLSAGNRHMLDRISLRYKDLISIKIWGNDSVNVGNELNHKSFFLDANDWDQRVSCELLAKPKEMVLYDNDGVIRGYYEYENPEEVDRLLLEAEIIKRHEY